MRIQRVLTSTPLARLHERTILQRGSFGELTWPQSKTIIINNPSYPDPLGGKSRDSFISTAPPNITVFANDTVNPFAHQVNGGFTAGQNDSSGALEANHAQGAEGYRPRITRVQEGVQAWSLAPHFDHA